ncbi:hypothetical protein ABLE91_05840 [Aquabacter sp. CN5-332]|uniref:baseplate hub protein n=1 Tax=Aquabacter sp. CN5-332 TaxID=3156608 RepID=UPI0032B5BCED
MWKRRVVATVSGRAGELVVRDLRIDFQAQRSIGSKQNEGVATIWNLKRENRGKLGEEFDTLKIEAGYESGEFGIIFKGQIRDVTIDQEGADIRSFLQCGDGDKGINKGVVTKTFPAGTKPREVADYLVSQMPDVDVGDLRGFDDLPAYKRPISLYGYASRELDELGRQHGVYWSVQNGAAEAIKSDGYINDTVVISSASGLIGAPKVTDKGVSLRSLLRPAIGPGRVVDVRSNFLDEASGRDKAASDQGGGLFRVASVSFAGSNRDKPFYCDIDGNRIQGGKVVK